MSQRRPHSPRDKLEKIIEKGREALMRHDADSGLVLTLTLFKVLHNINMQLAAVAPVTVCLYSSILCHFSCWVGGRTGPGGKPRHSFFPVTVSTFLLGKPKEFKVQRQYIIPPGSSGSVLRTHASWMCLENLTS